MSTEHAQVLRMKKLKDSGIIGIAARHNLRESQAELGADSHIDPLRTVQNVILRGAGTAAEVAEKAISLMEQADVLPLRKGAVVGLEILFSLPPDSGMAERDYFASCVDWAEQFFEVPILSAIIHNDEAAPHCHVLMLPLFNGRMNGSVVMGNQKRLLAMQSDFYAKVGQPYGLLRQAPVMRYSATVRGDAADKVVNSLRRLPKSLNDPAIRDALRDALAISMPVPLMALLNLSIPTARTPKPKTFTGIMIQNKPERKVKNPIGKASGTNPIGKAAKNRAEKTASLSCVGKGLNPPILQPANTPEPKGVKPARRSKKKVYGVQLSLLEDAADCGVRA